jgi:hypothetical protein
MAAVRNGQQATASPTLGLGSWLLSPAAFTLFIAFWRCGEGEEQKEDPKENQGKDGKKWKQSSPSPDLHSAHLNCVHMGHHKG